MAHRTYASKYLARHEDVDRVDKFKQYAEGGVRYYWIIDPLGLTVEAFELNGGQYLPSGSGSRNDIVRLGPFPALDISLPEIWFPHAK